MRKRNLMKSLATLFLMFVGVGGAWAANPEVLTPTVDTYLRQGNTANHGSETTIELCTSVADSKDFVGYLSFTLNKPEGMKVKSAVLRVTTERIKGDRSLNVFGFDATVPAAGKYEDYADAIAAAKAGTAVGTVSLEGQSGKAVSADDITAEKYQTITGWQNTIDITAYVQSITGNAVGLLLVRGADANNSNKIFTSEATGIENSNCSYFTSVTASDLVPQLTVEYEEDTGVSSIVKTPLVDTYLRKGNTANHGAETTMELKTYADGDADFVGYMSFDYSVPAGMELQSATLRVVSAQIKGDRTLNFYPFAADVAGDAKYADYADAIAAAKVTTAVGTVSLEGQNGKAVTSDNVDATKYQTIAAWQNTVDLTDFVKTQTGNFGLLLARNDANNSNKVFTSEATGISNSNCDYFNSCTANDLVPQLTLVFKATDPSTPVEPSSGDYKVNIEESEHGTVTASRQTANEGDEVTLTMTPEDETFKLVKLTITQETDDEGDSGTYSGARIKKASSSSIVFAPNIEVVTVSDTEYKFTMPENDVRVKAVFTNKPVAEPTIVYDADNNKVTMKLGVADDTFAPNAKVAYTTDGSDPATSDTKKEAAADVEIDVTEGMTIVRALGYDINRNPSQPVSQEVSRVHYLTVSKQWVAFCSPESYAVPTGLEAYVITSVTEPDEEGTGTVVLSEPQNVIEKDKAMLLKNTTIGTDAAETKFKLTASSAVISATPCAEFIGATTALTLSSDYTNYVLKDGKFLRTTSTGISQYNCYLRLGGTAAGARRFNIVNGGNGTTGIKTLNTEAADTAAWYTLNGVRVSQPTQKGVYIRGGKKVVVK